MKQSISKPLDAPKTNVATPFEKARAMPSDYVNDPDAQAHFRPLKTLLDEVNEEDRGRTEKVFRGLSSGLAKPGHLSHLERPNYDFTCYLN